MIFKILIFLLYVLKTVMTKLNFDARIWINVIEPRRSPFWNNIVLNFHSISSFTVTESPSVYVEHGALSFTIEKFVNLLSYWLQTNLGRFVMKLVLENIDLQKLKNFVSYFFIRWIIVSLKKFKRGKNAYFLLNKICFLSS